MSTNIIAAACILFLSAPAWAAENDAGSAADDMVIRAGIDESPAPTSASADRWTGGYIGLTGGYGFLNDSAPAKANGFDYGVFAGYNIRVMGPIVGGLEAEYAHIDRAFDDGSGVKAIETFNAKLRLGYAHERFFAYGILGAQHATSFVPFIPGQSAVDTTYLLGAGVDVALTNRISVGAEYTRAVYHDFSYPTLPFPLEVQVQRINARLNFKLN